MESIMKLRNSQFGAVAIVAALGASIPALAQAAGSADFGYSTYQRAVLDGVAQGSGVQTDAAPMWKAGPYATYLILEGVARDEALSMAARIGEHPVLVSTANHIERPAPNSFQSYQSFLLGYPAPVESQVTAAQDAR
jgi:hypothetical protein